MDDPTTALIFLDSEESDFDAFVDVLTSWGAEIRNKMSFCRCVLISGPAMMDVCNEVEKAGLGHVEYDAHKKTIFRAT